MASFDIAADEIGAYEKKLTANTVDSVTFHRDLEAVEVVSDGASAIYFTVDGSEPVVGGEKTHALPASSSVRVVDTPSPEGVRAVSRTTVVKLISAGTPTYSVARAEVN